MELMCKLMWLVIMFAGQMAGELLVSPVGLSVSTRLAPLAFQSQMVALWFLVPISQANADYTIFTKETEVAFFGILGLVCLAVGVITLHQQTCIEINATIINKQRGFCQLIGGDNQNLEREQMFSLLLLEVKNVH